MDFSDGEHGCFASSAGFCRQELTSAAEVDEAGTALGLIRCGSGCWACRCRKSTAALGWTASQPSSPWRIARACGALRWPLPRTTYAARRLSSGARRRRPSISYPDERRSSGALALRAGRRLPTWQAACGHRRSKKGIAGSSMAAKCGSPTRRAPVVDALHQPAGGEALSRVERASHRRGYAGV